MVVVGHIMSVPMISIQYTDNVFMGMTVFFNRVTMDDCDWC